MKLSAANLQLLPSGVRIPRYDRSKVVPRIVYIGVGGFMRAHQAVYSDDLLAGGCDYGYCGVGLLKHDTHIRDALRSQDCLHTVIKRDTTGDRARVVDGCAGLPDRFPDHHRRGLLHPSGHGAVR